jgi:tol-pal system protein YbgF
LPPQTSATPADDAGSEAAYRDAFGLLKSGEYDRAIAAFETFQQRYPKSQYGDNAQFWLAEAHYVNRDFAAALPAYQQMLAGYPTSKKLSHALLKIGYSYAELGKTAEALQVLNELQQRFPDTAAAQLAAQRIAQMPAN